MTTIKPKHVVEMMHITDGKTESLIIKVRGRGWFISSGENSEFKKRDNLTLTRLKGWLSEPTDWHRIRVCHFHGGAK